MVLIVPLLILILLAILFPKFVKVIIWGFLFLISLAMFFVATHAKAAENSWDSPLMIQGLRNCFWGETVTRADGIRRATALGVNIEGALAAYCGNLMGTQWQCERSGKSIEDCTAIILEYAREAIDAEMTRAGYDTGGK